MTLAASLFRWASVPVLLAAALAFAFATHDTSPPGNGGTTYCYRRIRTHDAFQPVAQCFSVVNGSFSRVWATNHPESSSLLREGYVIPGLWDGHGHLGAWGEFLHSVDLFNSPSLDEVRSRLKIFLAKNPDTGTKDLWLRGTGWDQDRYGRMPTAKDLSDDETLKGKFILLDRNDGHCIWVSQPVLDLLPKNMTDVPGGEIIRDPGPGVFCDNAMDPAYALLPATSDEVKTRQIRDAMQDLNRVGLVGVHDASTPPDDVKLYNKLADGDDWTVRVYSMLECEDRNQFCPNATGKIARSDSRFWVQSVKLFADGALGSWGSALLEPYSDHTNKTGSLLVNATTMTNLTRAWALAGYQVNVHAIGDLANREVINAFTAGLQAVCPEAGDNPEALRVCQTKHRFRIEHSQIVHPADQIRMHQIGLIPSIQPTHPTDDMRFALERLGPFRTDVEAYRMQSFWDIAPILGSDFPVEPPNPFQGIYAAVTRKSPTTGKGFNGSDEGWHADQALTFDQAMWGFTGATAYAAFLDGKAGIIKGGAFADWVVLDKPIEEIPIEDFRNLTVKETWVAGRRVYPVEPRA